MPLSMAASRVASWVPSWPRDLKPYCLRHKPPASVNSNSDSLRLVAPKSTTKNDFLFSIDSVHALFHKFFRPNTQRPARQRARHGKLVVITRNISPGQTEKRQRLLSGITRSILHRRRFSSGKFLPKVGDGRLQPFGQ